MRIYLAIYCCLFIDNFHQILQNSFQFSINTNINIFEIIDILDLLSGIVHRLLPLFVNKLFLFFIKLCQKYKFLLLLLLPL
jgi:hypothetical protein